jgi:hypothetical protein
MRTVILLLILSSVAVAEQPGDRERKVRVALAIAASAQCGECRFDEAGCRVEASKARKPLVLFVGPACGRCGTAATKAGAVACVVAKYDGDGLGDKPRAVVLEPNPAGGFWLAATVNAPTPEKVTAAVTKTKPPAKALDWDLK